MKGKDIFVIALTGSRRCGKDVVADHLCRTYGFKKASFARPLKQMVASAFGLTWDQVDGQDKDVVDERYGVPPRKILQFMGTEVMQHHLQTLFPDVGKMFWAKRLVNEHIHGTLANQHKRLVISDMRFVHEYEYILQAVQQCGGELKVWKVERDPQCKVMDSIIDSHPSEREWVRIRADESLHNDAAICDLHKKVELIIATYI